MAALIKFKRGTESAIKNEILDAGEPAFTVDTHKLFVGDGTTPGGYLIGGGGLSYGFGYTILYFNEDFQAIPYVLHAVDTTEGIINVDLPEGPNNGAEVRIIDVAKNFNVNKVVLRGNGNKINDSYANYDLTEVGSYILYFGLSGTEKTWFVVKVTGQRWFDSGVKDSWDIVYTDSSINANNKESILTDTTNNTITINTPSNPILGYKFQIQDYNKTWGTNKVTVNTTENFRCSSINSLDFNENGMVVTFIYDVCENGEFSWTVKIGRSLVSQDSNIDNWYQNGAENYDVIRWSSVLNQWVVGPMVVGGWNLEDYYTATNGQILIYDETLSDWKASNIKQIFGSYYTGTDGQILTYDSSLGKWVATDIITIFNQFYPATDGQILKYNDNTSEWETGTYDHSNLPDSEGQLINIDSGDSPGSIDEVPVTLIRSIVTDNEGHLISAETKTILVTGYSKTDHNHDARYSKPASQHSHYAESLTWLTSHSHAHSDIVPFDNGAGGGYGYDVDYACTMYTGYGIGYWHTETDGHGIGGSSCRNYETYWEGKTYQLLLDWGYFG